MGSSVNSEDVDHKKWDRTPPPNIKPSLNVCRRVQGWNLQTELNYLICSSFIAYLYANGCLHGIQSWNMHVHSCMHACTCMGHYTYTHPPTHPSIHHPSPRGWPPKSVKMLSQWTTYFRFCDRFTISVDSSTYGWVYGFVGWLMEGSFFWHLMLLKHLNCRAIFMSAERILRKCDAEKSLILTVWSAEKCKWKCESFNVKEKWKTAAVGYGRQNFISILVMTSKVHNILNLIIFCGILSSNVTNMLSPSRC